MGQYQEVQQIPHLQFDSIVIQSQEEQEEQEGKAKEEGQEQEQEDVRKGPGRPRRESPKLEKPLGRGPYPCTRYLNKNWIWELGA